MQQHTEEYHVPKSYLVEGLHFFGCRNVQVAVAVVRDSVPHFTNLSYDLGKK